MLLFNCWQRSLRRACESSVCRETTSSDNLRNTRRISSVWTVPRAHIALNSWNILGHCWGHSRLIISTKMREIASSVCRCACNRGMMSEPSAARSAMQDSLMKTFSSCEITYQRYLMQCSMSWIPENNQKYQVWKKLEKKKTILKCALQFLIWLICVPLLIVHTFTNMGKIEKIVEIFLHYFWGRQKTLLLTWHYWQPLYNIFFPQYYYIFF